VRATGHKEPLWTESTFSEEQRAEQEPQVEQEPRLEQEPRVEQEPPEEPLTAMQEPVKFSGDEPVSQEVAEADLEQLGDLIQEEKSSKREPRRDVEQFSFSFLGTDSSEKKRVVEEKKPLPTKLIQLNVVPRRGQFPGREILYAVSETGLQFGDMNIYHFPDDESSRNETLFSMASMVEPGSFNPEQMDDFFTPGLVLFALLPGPKDGLTIFSEMLHTAEQLATLLDGELKDDNHSDLSKQTIEHMREEIQEFHRKLQLAKSAR
jgi:cell division protein ZipA